MLEIKLFRIYGGEDVALSLNSNKLCNVSSIIVKMDLIQRQGDGNSQSIDNQIVSQLEKDKRKYIEFELCKRLYCYLIHSGYIPRRWGDFNIPKNDLINITLNHKSIILL